MLDYYSLLWYHIALFHPFQLDQSYLTYTNNSWTLVDAIPFRFMFGDIVATQAMKKQIGWRI